MSKSPSESAEMEHMFENVEEIREKYATQLASVRALLTLPCPDDIMVYRFLCGHKFVIERAAEHLNTTLAWRQEHGLDQLRTKAEKITQKQYPYADKVLAVHPHNIIHGHDKKGQPLSVERLGHANPYLMTRTVKFEEMLAYHFYHMEAKAAIVANLSQTHGKVMRTCKIMDLSGLGRQHLDRKGLVFFKRIVDLSQNNYPEMLGTLYVVNTPWIFNLGWKIVKPWLNPMTLSKIVILGNKDFLDTLKENIDEEFIPEFLGGKCTCNGEGCVPLVDPDASMTTQQINARGSFEHKVTINQDMIEKLQQAQLQSSSSSSTSSPLSPASSWVGVQVSYEFRTKKNDIAFEIKSVSPDGTTKVLKEKKRYESDQDTISGTFLVPDSDLMLLFSFDNSFSYFTGKTLLYRIDVEPQWSTNSSDEEADAKEIEAVLAEEAVISPEITLTEEPTKAQ